MSLNESYPQHVVTAVIVAHDGVAWLARVADAISEQTRPIQRVVAVDTGSRDRSGSVLTAKFGQAAVFGMDRNTGYAAAVARAVSHRAANVPVPSAAGIPPSDRIEWLWLLHDDCEPAPDALEQLLRGAAETKTAAVLGPKLRDWSSRETILEAGITLDSAARRVTNIEPREVDQGQHDGDRDVVAVSSAGMLVRRDVWDQLGGFDAGMSLFMEDIDFCWRVHSAGYRVRVITDAVAYHVRAATRRRRPISVGRRAQMLDRRNGLLTLLGNLTFGRMLVATVSNVVVSVLRVAFFLLAKRLVAALDESAAVIAVLVHPLGMFLARRRRASGRRAAYSRIRGDLPSGHSARRAYEFLLSAMMKPGHMDAAGAHHASVDPVDDDSLLVDNGLARKILTSPGVLTVIGLIVVTLVASRSLLGSGPLGGGALVPTWGGATDLWRTSLQAFHPAGVGSTAPAPAYLAVISALATVLFGKAWLALDVILIGCVPLAGLTARIAASRVTSSAAIRSWAAASYALLPVAMGVIASGRFGSAVAFVLLPLIALALSRIFTSTDRRAGRAAWAAGLLVAVGAAFVPLLWLMAVGACLVGAALVRNTRPRVLRNLAIVIAVPPVLLFPWTATFFSRPSQLLLEAGIPLHGASVAARPMMMLSPGGPGLPPYWVTAGLIAVAFAALFVGRRRKLVMAGWAVALSGMLVAILASHVVVHPAPQSTVILWAGLPLALAALGLLLAAVAGADGLTRMRPSRRGWRMVASVRGSWVAAAALAGCSAPLLAAGFWVISGVKGPVHPAKDQFVPELVAVADGQRHQVRTLVLRSDHGQVSYLLMRGTSPSLADTALIVPGPAQLALNDAVAALISPTGGQAVRLSQVLAEFDIGYVLLRAPANPQLINVLNKVEGLRPYSTTPTYSLWQLQTSPAHVTVLEKDGTVVPVPSGPVGLSGVRAPSAGGIVMLAEPAAPGWYASLSGRPLARVASPAGSWAQAFRLPPGGGMLQVGYSGLARELSLVGELFVLLIVAGLALPGVYLADQPDQRVTGGRHGAGRSDAITAENEGTEETRADASGERSGLTADEAGSEAVAAGAAAGAGVPDGTGKPRSTGDLTDGRELEEAGVPAASDGARSAPPVRSLAGRVAKARPRPAGHGADSPSPPASPARLARAWPYADETDPGRVPAAGHAEGAPGDDVSYQGGVVPRQEIGQTSWPQESARMGGGMPRDGQFSRSAETKGGRGVSGSWPPPAELPGSRSQGVPDYPRQPRPDPSGDGSWPADGPAPGGPARTGRGRWPRPGERGLARPSASAGDERYYQDRRAEPRGGRDASAAVRPGGWDGADGELEPLPPADPNRWPARRSAWRPQPGTPPGLPEQGLPEQGLSGQGLPGQRTPEQQWREPEPNAGRRALRGWRSRSGQRRAAEPSRGWDQLDVRRGDNYDQPESGRDSERESWR